VTRACLGEWSLKFEVRLRIYIKCTGTMELISSSSIDRSIDRIVSRLAPSGIRELYPNQRKLLHEFCLGKDIFYTGKDETSTILDIITCVFQKPLMREKLFHPVCFLIWFKT
jgi:hypothetical protein